ncbi:MAG: transglycosylase SLT domain-containing protein [Pseudomonadota bacterium]
MRRPLGLCLIALLALVACDDDDTPEGVVQASPDVPALPVTQWDFRPEAETWSTSALVALQGHGAPLLSLVPGDIETYCPAYPNLGDAGRSAFWTTFLSALAKHESTWAPDAVGGDGRWFGLLQISPATARGYGCAAGTGEALKDGSANLRCAIRIMAVTVPRDDVISRGGRGVAADWGPFSSARKSAEIQEWTRKQPYCQ